MPDDRLVKMVLLDSVDGVRQTGRPLTSPTINAHERDYCYVDTRVYQ